MRSQPIRPMFPKLALLWNNIMYFIMTVHASSLSQPPPYELIHHSFQRITELSGLVELVCHEKSTAETLSVNEISIWLNRTSVTDPDLREREDVGVVEVNGCCGLRFNLTQQLEGNFTCGKRIDMAKCKGEPSKDTNL